jgi:hypothetical protein
MADQSLAMLAFEVRWKTLKLLENVTEEMARFAPPGLNNTILWHAGHALTVVEALSFAPAAGREPTYPDGYYERFSWKSDPRTVTSWPTLGEVVERLKAQRDQLIPVLEKLTPEQLERPMGDRGRSLRYHIIHGLHDEAGHGGEIHLLKKLWAKRA